MSEYVLLLQRAWHIITRHKVMLAFAFIALLSPQGELTPFGMVPRYMRFKVAGIFQSG